MGTLTTATAWERFVHYRDSKGLRMDWIDRNSTLNRGQIWGMLNNVYGHPDTPEKRREILRVLNLGPGDPVQESDIWGKHADADADGIGKEGE